MPAIKGLEHVVAATTRLGALDGEVGEFAIGGFPLEQLANKRRIRPQSDDGPTDRSWIPME